MKHGSRTGRWRGLGTPLIALALAGAGIGVTAGSASAATACPAGSVCLYKDATYQGSVSIQRILVESPYQIANFVNSHFQDGSTIENQVSSVINNSDRTLCMWSNRNFQGQYTWVVTKHFSAPQITNDVMSSARTVPAGQSC
ncbi:MULTISPECIES: peptidase inhibitor family I36 protein [Streptomyces]|uniref:peptidase inhibitor family I36 protein n=1 Tax=Streptomyces TaxID=1883 RepID=UPI0023DD1125|nr:peptidase inhibitor family I36 protein [Streptomyces sp. FXJ1.172]WEP00915.1 peptidase inhibitor family I36 protein [Streptomyces sp. FXJ1.172]